MSDSGSGEVVKPKPRPRSKLLQGGGATAQRGGAAGMLPVKEEGQDRDLKVSIEEREKVGIKSDAYISYKVCTKVSLLGGRGG